MIRVIAGSISNSQPLRPVRGFAQHLFFEDVPVLGDVLGVKRWGQQSAAVEVFFAREVEHRAGAEDLAEIERRAPQHVPARPEQILDPIGIADHHGPPEAGQIEGEHVGVPPSQRCDQSAPGQQERKALYRLR